MLMTLIVRIVQMIVMNVMTEILVQIAPLGSICTKVNAMMTAL